MRLGRLLHVRSNALLFVFLLHNLTCPACAASSNNCQLLSSTDALLLVDPQNCFMVEQNVSGVTRYNLSEEAAPDGIIPSGPLPVTGSDEVITAMNSWLEFRDSVGRTANVLGTLDYHPERHCSFCDAYKDGVFPFTADGNIAFCLRGAQTIDHFNESHRCRDAVSEQDYADNTYVQWAEHCVAGTFGSRFAPSLMIPDDMAVFKLGVEETTDVYSVFDGGRLSTAAAGTHDMHASSTEELADASVTLHTELLRLKVARLFVMGLATDYTVGRTLKHALGILDDEANYKLPSGSQVILVDAASAAILKANADAVRAAVVATTDPVGFVLTSTSPADAMAELCIGTCDDRADCDSAAQYCKELDNFTWGVCASCKFISPGSGVCSGHGTCTADGSCACDFGYSDDFCSNGQVLITVCMLVVFGGLLLLALLVLFGCRLRRRRPVVALLKSTLTTPELSLDSHTHYHLFLSHIWATGQDQVAVIKRRVSALLPGARIWLDVDDMLDISNLEDYVRDSAVVLIFLSAGYFLSKNALREVRAARSLKKPLVLVHEQDEAKGGATIKSLLAECPPALAGYVFGAEAARSSESVAQSHKPSESGGGGGAPIPWLRVGHFQLVTLKLICSATLLHSPRYKKERERGGKLPLVVPGEITNKQWRLEKHALLYVSPNNPGAADVAAAIGPFVNRLEVMAPAQRPSVLFPATTPQTAKAGEHFSSKSVGFGSVGSKLTGRESLAVEEMSTSHADGAVSDRAWTERLPLGHVPSCAPTTFARRALVPRVLGIFKAAELRSSPELWGSEPQVSVNASDARAAPSATEATSTPPGPAEAQRSAASSASSRPKSTYDKIRNRRQSHEMRPDKPTHMLLYLNLNSWLGSEGDLLAEEVRAARLANVPIVMVHEMDAESGGCPFARFFAVTPPDLVKNGLYSKSLATPWLPGAHRRVSLALVATSMGAISRERKRRVLSEAAVTPAASAPAPAAPAPMAPSLEHKAAEQRSSDSAVAESQRLRTRVSEEPRPDLQGEVPSPSALQAMAPSQD